MFGDLLYDIIFFTIPAIMLLFFGICLQRYRSAVSQNREKPDTFSTEEIKMRKTWLIVASVIAGVLAVVVVGFVVLLFMAVAFM